MKTKPVSLGDREPKVRGLAKLHRALLWLCAIIGLSLPLHASPHKNRTVIIISIDGFPAYALDDPRLPVPTLRKLAREGLSAASMHPVNPTVTWPNHTSMVTGVDPSQHQVLYNGLLVRIPGSVIPKVEPWRDKDVMVHAPTLYDLAFQAGLTIAQVDWVAIYHAKTITWSFPEIPDPQGAIERELISQGLVTEEQLRTFDNSSQTWRDDIWTSAAALILKKHKPNLLLFHLLTLDGVNHEYGPMSQASFTAMAFLDSQVKKLLEALHRSGREKKTTVLIVSDHGFRTIQHKIHPSVLLRQNGFITGEGPGITGDAWVMSEGGSALVYVKDPARRAELLPRLRQVFEGAEGVSHIYGTDEFAQLGLPAPTGSEQAPDLVLAAAPDYAFSGESEGDYMTHVEEGGAHGYINQDPKMDAIFLAWGKGISKGAHLGTIDNVDIAPTAAALLGIDMPNIKGHAIPLIANGKGSRR